MWRRAGAEVEDAHCRGALTKVTEADRRAAAARVSRLAEERAAGAART
jgi:hypothetical protein